MKHIGDKIDEFIEVEHKAHPEQVCQFFERVQLNYDEAIRTATRYLILMLATWFISFAINKGWITRIELLGFDFKPEMTIASPFLIGLVSYLALATVAGAIVLWEAIIRRLRYILPTAWEHYLENFLAPPTFSNVERMLEPIIDQSPLSVYFSRTWFVLVTMTMFGGGLAGIAHITYLLLWPETGPQVTHWAVIASSGALGVIAWLRGVMLCASAIAVTGGYNLTHHRGARKTPPTEQACPEDTLPTSSNSS